MGRKRRFQRRTGLKEQRSIGNAATRFVHAPLFAITSPADRIAVGSLRT
jgi:hypothetical protein